MLGDRVEAALSSVGLSQEVVERWLGAPCHCQERKDKLNQLQRWAATVLRGRVEGMREVLLRFAAPIFS